MDTRGQRTGVQHGLQRAQGAGPRRRDRRAAGAARGRRARVGQAAAADILGDGGPDTGVLRGTQGVGAVLRQDHRRDMAAGLRVLGREDRARGEDVVSVVPRRRTAISAIYGAISRTYT